MPRRQFSSREVLKVFDKANWEYAGAGSGSSHVVMTKRDHSGHKYTITIPMGKDPIPIGTLKSIMKRAGGDDWDKFCRWLDNNC
ncbi:type II toxin-antitoxin system HicA family toxin [Halococcus sp. AFM35]|uniref:type II toxin-antitoxin system HicA family toxin n=1 Tax=Halococcus sp. AFM35 TaxID=3421653 RepID=UPI003EBAD36C